MLHQEKRTLHSFLCQLLVSLAHIIIIPKSSPLIKRLVVHELVDVITQLGVRRSRGFYNRKMIYKHRGYVMKTKARRERELIDFD